MSERVPRTAPAQLQFASNPAPGAPDSDAADPPFDLRPAAVRVLLERRRHSGLDEETVTTALVSRNPTATAPTRYAPDAPALTIRRRDSPLEAVSSKSGEFRLLHSHSRSELTEVRLNKNVRLTLTPAGAVLETFYLLSGKLGGEVEGKPCAFEPGDTIITEDLPEPLILTALEETRLLYLTEKPQFHSFSERLSELKRLAVEVELKDGYTADHCERLQELSYTTGEVLGLDAARLRLLDLGSYLHDVGKINVPLELLIKPGKLSPEEWDIIKQHPRYGYELLLNTSLDKVGFIVEQHHERFDGSGYPYGLSGDKISVEAAIVAVADTFDAMTTDRPYRKAMSPSEALAELDRYTNVHYPTEIVRAFTAVLKERAILY